MQGHSLQAAFSRSLHIPVHDGLGFHSICCCCCCYKNCQIYRRVGRTVLTCYTQQRLPLGPFAASMYVLVRAPVPLRVNYFKGSCRHQHSSISKGKGHFSLISTPLFSYLSNLKSLILSTVQSTSKFLRLPPNIFLVVLL